MAVASFTLMTSASVVAAQGAQGASARAVSAWPKWGHLPTLPAIRPQSQPAHRVATLGPDIPGTVPTILTTNWSGYVDSVGQFTGVSGQWVVPTVQPSGLLAASSTWIGIDGVTNHSLIQTGTTQSTTGGVNTYFAWYEILPAVAIPVGPVSPGDQMRASVVENSPGAWTITIADLTSSQAHSIPVFYSGPATSAEWIEEDPIVGGVKPPLANFGTVRFSGLGVGGTNPPVASMTPFDMVDGGGHVIAQPGSIVNDGFPITYGGPAPPPPTITTTSLPSAAIGLSYFQSLIASGGTSPYSWSVTSGTLPAGLSLNPLTGALSGTPTVAGTQKPTFKVTDANQQSATATLSITVVSSPGPYSPLTPVRVCDTRPGNPSGLTGVATQCDGSTIPALGTRTINVAGSFGVPSTADAVVLNVTVVNPAATGYLTLFPTGAGQPFASNLNYSPGEVVPNLVEVGTGPGGQVSIFSLAKADVVVDLEGYVSPSAAGGSGSGLYNPLPSPARLCDTRAANPSGLVGGDAQCNGVANAGTRLAAGATHSVQVATNNSIPQGATAAVLNVTVVNPAASGYLTVFPGGATQPNTANVNYAAGQVTGNRVIVPLSTTGATAGQIAVYSKSAADVVVDVSGYYSAAGGTGSEFTAEPAPVRICDTRPGNPSGLTGPANQCDNLTLAAATTDTPISVTGLAGVPSGAKAVVVNLTAVVPTQGTFLTVFPAGTTRPLASDLNPAAGDVKGNLTVATLSSSGTISIYNNTGSVNVVVDVLGWYS